MDFELTFDLYFIVEFGYEYFDLIFDFDEKKMSGTYVRYPERNELTSAINESLIIEFYNR